ncbi:MAG: DUF393 domain-containing protein [Candidatus Latescibacteria bacterium]|nr:DUF393 domain-containing protein [Candidatus Latescibacterota bacterium]
MPGGGSVVNSLPASEVTSETVDRPIVFYDGVCGLCNRLIEFLLFHDKNELLRFAPLQGETAAALLPARPQCPMVWSLMYMDGIGIYRESEAVLRVFQLLGGFWRLTALARLIPSSFRNRIYRRLAENRYRWFGTSFRCDMEGQGRQLRFLP